MPWLKATLGRLGGTRPSKRCNTVRFTMPGWSEDSSQGGDLRVWRDSQGDVLSLSAVESLGLPEISNETALQAYSRELAENRHGGLIEVRVVTGTLGATAGLIYKRLEKPAYIFTGMLLVPRQHGSQVWTLVAGERGTTGVREAVITLELVNAGKLRMQDYERSWAQDPYDPTYCGVDRSVLRFISDDESYDERFPEHPLSKVRRVLATLPDWVVDPGSPS
jgi:hypothetical protein